MQASDENKDKYQLWYLLIDLIPILQNQHNENHLAERKENY